MFGRRKMYKKGLEDATRINTDFYKKQEAALKKLREEVKSGNKKLEDMLNEIGENINGVYDYLTESEKAALYHLCTPKDIKKLDESERRLLVAVLYQLANDEGGWNLTDNQKKYVRSVQQYLEITNPQTEMDLSAVENIDSIESQKVILQVVLEFFYLQDAEELSDQQEEFLGYFSLNRKQAEQIENYVAKLYNTVGAEGICEKYGFVANTDDLLDNPGSGEVRTNTDFYYDCRINAVRLWSDDTVIVEPREQCGLSSLRWVDNLLIWSGNSTGECIDHVMDLSTLREIATFTGKDRIAYDSIFSNKFFCYYDEYYIVKNYAHTFSKKIKLPDKYSRHILYAMTDDFLIIEGIEEGEFSADRHDLIIYNFENDTQEIIDSFDTCDIALCGLYAIHEKLYIFVVQRNTACSAQRNTACSAIDLARGLSQIFSPAFDDIWCYDLKSKKYIWKQYKVLETKSPLFVSFGKQFSKQCVSYNDKMEFWMEREAGHYWRVVVNIKDGTILSQQEMVPFDGCAYKYIQRIDHTIVYMFFGYRNGTDFHIQTFTYDISEEVSTYSGQETEQAKEILKKMGI